LPYFGIIKNVLEKIKSPSLEDLCEAIKIIPIPYEVLISQNPVENIAMYIAILDINKNHKEIPKTTSDLVGKIRNFYWSNKDFSEISSSLEYPLKILPGDLHEKRLESLPKPILEELNQAFLIDYIPSKKKYTREQAIEEISKDLYKIYKQNNQF
ncbi:MAG TPA: hypothetical protein PLK34_03100, partial [Candidatus Pacearchaeota archaeon]|nr:hypothetical protein [Candidatus Pacearchaeota archaeon]